MSTITRTMEPQAMPQGHDDKRSPWFIPADLREHYEPDFNELTVMEQSRTGNAAYQSSAAAGFLLDYGLANPDAPMPSRVQRLVRGVTSEEGELSLQNVARRIDDELTWEERCWAYHMRVLLPAARTRKAAAETRAIAEAARIARQTCAVCGQDKPDTSPRGISPAGRLLNGPSSSSGGLTVQACELCAQAVHEQYVERHASVNGKKRRELAAAWLDSHTR